jgi:hypothetical protein
MSPRLRTGERLSKALSRWVGLLSPQALLPENPNRAR